MQLEGSILQGEWPLIHALVLIYFAETCFDIHSYVSYVYYHTLVRILISVQLNIDLIEHTYVLHACYNIYIYIKLYIYIYRILSHKSSW